MLSTLVQIEHFTSRLHSSLQASIYYYHIKMQVTSHTLKVCSVSLPTPLEGFADGILANGSKMFG